MNDQDYPNIYEDLKESEILIRYDDQKNAVLEFDDFKLFLQEFPSYIRLTEEKQFGLYNVKAIKSKSTHNDELLDKYKRLSSLENILKLISTERSVTSPRCYAYELFERRKITIHSSIDYEVFIQVDFKTIEQVEEIYSKLSSVNKPQFELEKSFLLKAIEDIFKSNKVSTKLTFNDVITNLEEICLEHELLHKAYIDKLDTDSIRFDYQKKIQEVNDKLQSILSDMQNKMIVPPIALILVYANVFDKATTVKGITMLVLIAFFGIVTYYGYNQILIIKNYQSNIQSWKKFYQKFLSKNYAKLSNDFSKSSIIATNIEIIIWITIVINWILYIIAFAFMF